MDKRMKQNMGIPSVIPADGQMARQPSIAAMPGDNNVVYGIPDNRPKPAVRSA